MTNYVRTAVVDTELDSSAIAAEVENPRCGAVVTFCGVVRNHDNGREVVAIEYSAHPSAALRLRELAEQVRAAAV